MNSSVNSNSNNSVSRPASFEGAWPVKLTTYEEMNNASGDYVEFLENGVSSNKATFLGIWEHLNAESDNAVIVENGDEKHLAIWKNGSVYHCQWLPLIDPNDAEMYESLDII
jgi:hypothetical protein